MRQESLVFVDARAQSRENPDMFERVAEDVIDSVSAGDLAKICAKGERFWVIVTSVAGDVLRGQISNYLHRTDQHGLKHEGFVTFERRHIYDVDKRCVAVA